ncbi:energy transducer TonB [Flavobacterium sp. K5-23]|uniref:energy transducer TonB n=1 Tax=Flavobacterium sp. K5-23 TaxID=2746225 RepID=UPI00200FB553|nr:energy transducer TonB [Flavobacterium sp. K5-23]UQD56231.1 energy transducer TonB [Flavobacterium sp. K5-23]
MSKLSLYENSWINLVFENRNKEYGAYQLRQENTKTSLFALFMGLFLCASLLSIPRVLQYFNSENVSQVETTEILDKIIQVSNILPVIKEKTVLPKAIQQKTVEANPKDQLVNPIIVKAVDATPDIAKNSEITATKTVTNEGTGITGINPTASEGTGNGSAIVPDNGNAIISSTILDKLPEFPGGMGKFYTYIGRNFETPEIEGERSIRIFVSFVIEKDGSMTDIQVKNDPGYGLGKEAMRVLKSLKTKWTPGILNAKPVRTSYSLPITVQMN